LSRRVTILPLARADRIRLEAFLQTKSPSAAHRAAQAIAHAIRTLDEHAERGRPVSDRGLRELNVRFGRDGYVIQHAVTDWEVLVARVFHAREDR
jgi:plasmid stabilization system protein ParE